MSLYLKEIYYPSGGLRVLEKALPSARLNGFMKVSEALSFARGSRIDIAFLDIEIGKASGLVLRLS